MEESCNTSQRQEVDQKEGPHVIALTTDAFEKILDDLGDESHAMHGWRVDMSVHVDIWEMVLKAHRYAQCQETNILLKQKIIDGLWLYKGAEV